MTAPLTVVIDEAVDTQPGRCRCGSLMRPEGTTAAQYPGTVPNWGNGQCRVCDYAAAGRDPEDRFMTRERAGYLDNLRAGIEAGRRRRGIPENGTGAGRMPISELVIAIGAKEESK